ncbi:hypothetical protein BU197_19205 [Streptomyces sp. CBMA291]|nr:hypothetical protein [Streptomyces sp. CBMA291]MBD0712760.1 hypothetical protein [Streptomyces sp. CBMA370]
MAGRGRWEGEEGTEGEEGKKGEEGEDFEESFMLCTGPGSGVVPVSCVTPAFPRRVAVPLVSLDAGNGRSLDLSWRGTLPEPTELFQSGH